LLFTFAYPRFLFDSVSSRRPKYALVHHVAGAILSTAIFTFLSPHWKNPLLDKNSVALAVGGLVAICIFLIAALLLLIRKSSSLTLVASVLFWPYWLASTLIFEDRWFQETGPYAAYYFLCLAIPVVFAFAAGAVAYRPKGRSCTAISRDCCHPSGLLECDKRRCFGQRMADFQRAVGRPDTFLFFRSNLLSPRDRFRNVTGACDSDNWVAAHS